MQIGNATVYIEQVPESLEIETDDEVYLVSPDPKEAFEKAAEVLQECVRVVGERVENLADKVKPREVAVEFTVALEGRSKWQIVPFLFAGEAKAKTGLKVTAVWGKLGTPSGGGQGQDGEDEGQDES